jgi:tetratricopeptide (TPR) repeat protein
MDQSIGVGTSARPTLAAGLDPSSGVAAVVSPKPRAELERARIAYAGGRSGEAGRITEELVARLGEHVGPSAEEAEVLGSAYTLLGLLHHLRGEAAYEPFAHAVEAFAQVPQDRLECGPGVTVADYGIALHHTGAHRQAVAALDRALELGHDTPDVRRYRAAARLGRGDRDDQEDAYRLLADTVQRTPDDWQAREWLARVTEELAHDPAETAAQWAAAWQVLYEEGLFGRALEPAQRAVRAYRQAVGVRPEDVGLLLAAGRTLAQVGLGQEAAGLLRRAAALPAASQIRLDVADALLDLGDHETAGALTRAVIAVEPGSERAVTGLTRALSRRRDEQSLDEAERLLTVFLQSHPDSVDAEAQLGELNRQRGRPEAAVFHFNRALDAGGERDAARAALLHGRKGLALLQLRRPREGMKELRTAAARAPETPWISFSLADAYRDMGDAEGAIAVLRNFIELHPPAKGRAAWVAAMIRLGDLLAETGSWAEARAVFRQIPEPEASSSDVLGPLTTFLLDSGQDTEALEAFLHAEHVHPDDLEIRALHARVLYRTGRLDEAADLLTSVLDQDAGRWGDRAWLGEVERLRGHLPIALEQLDRVLEEHPEHTWSLSSRAAVHLRMDQLTKAAHDLRTCLDHAPRDLFSLRLLADVLIPLHHYQEIIGRFQRALRSGDTAPDAGLWREYGETLRKLAPHAEAAKELSDAEADLTKSLQWSPRDLNRLRALRELLIAQDRCGEAVGAFDHAVRSSGDNADAGLWCEYGETLRRTGRYSEARGALDMALETALGQGAEQQIAQVRHTLGRLLLDQGKYDEAANLMDQAAHGTRNQAARYDACTARILAHRYAEARDLLRHWLDAQPSDADTWWLLSQVYYRVGSWQQAVTAAQNAVKYDPNDAKKQELLGWSILRTGKDLATAQAAFDNAIELDPSQPSRREGKARVLWQAGQHDDARTACQELLDCLPSESMQDAAARIIRGWCLARLNRPRDAVAEYMRVLPGAGEERAMIEFDLALCQIRAGRADDAEKTLEQAWLDVGFQRAPERPGHQPQLRRRGILAEIWQDVQAERAHDRVLRRSRVVREVLVCLDEELRKLPEIGPESDTKSAASESSTLHADEFSGSARGS